LKNPKTNNKSHESNTFFKVGLAFCLCASFLIMIEGIILILHSPLSFPSQFLAQWGGYIDLLFGVVVFVGFIAIAYHHKRETVKTVGAILAGAFSIASFILFGGGFYVGFILGLFGALLTAAKD
jgi:glucan phosphoethanolaminetransferase (alkaline phosphatase superfamily)